MHFLRQLGINENLYYMLIENLILLIIWRKNKKTGCFPKKNTMLIEQNCIHSLLQLRKSKWQGSRLK